MSDQEIEARIVDADIVIKLRPEPHAKDGSPVVTCESCGHQFAPESAVSEDRLCAECDLNRAGPSAEAEGSQGADANAPAEPDPRTEPAVPQERPRCNMGSDKPVGGGIAVVMLLMISGGVALLTTAAAAFEPQLFPSFVAAMRALIVLWLVLFLVGAMLRSLFAHR